MDFLHLLDAPIDSPEAKAVFSKLGTPVIRAYGRDTQTTRYFNFFLKGVSFVVTSDSKIDCFWLYNQAVDKFSKFEGTIPHGINLSDVNADVVRRSEVGFP